MYKINVLTGGDCLGTKLGPRYYLTKWAALRALIIFLSVGCEVELSKLVIKKCGRYSWSIDETADI